MDIGRFLDCLIPPPLGVFIDFRRIGHSAALIIRGQNSTANSPRQGVNTEYGRLFSIILALAKFSYFGEEEEEESRRPIKLWGII